jgi:hypothetical protein
MNDVSMQLRMISNCPAEFIRLNGAGDGLGWPPLNIRIQGLRSHERRITCLVGAWAVTCDGFAKLLKLAAERAWHR